MEFGDTEAYRVSKEAQKMQSEVKKSHSVTPTCVSMFYLSDGVKPNQPLRHTVELIMSVLLEELQVVLKTE